MHTSFAQRVAAYQVASGSRAVVWLAPVAPELPLAYLRFDEPALPYGRDLISATAGRVCGWVFDLAAYLAYGAAGIIALERTLALGAGQGITILHGAFALPDYVRLLDGPLTCDAVTIADTGVCPAYAQQPHVGVFVVQTDQTRRALNYGVFNPNVGAFQLPLADSGHTLCLCRLDPLRVQEKGEDKARFLEAVQALVHDANNQFGQ